MIGFRYLPTRLRLSTDCRLNQPIPLGANNSDNVTNRIYLSSAIVPHYIVLHLLLLIRFEYNAKYIYLYDIQLFLNKDIHGILLLAAHCFICACPFQSTLYVSRFILSPIDSGTVPIHMIKLPKVSK